MGHIHLCVLQLTSTPYILRVFDRLGFVPLSRLGVTVQFSVPIFGLRSPDRWSCSPYLPRFTHIILFRFSIPTGIYDEVIPYSSVPSR